MPLDPEILAKIKDDFIVGRYSLLLGAGVSLDSENEQGEPIPSTSTLKKSLVELKGASESSSLQRLYGSLSEQEKQEYVVRPYLKCSGGRSVKKITEFYWRRIYSFNIDDTLEDAYEKSSSIQSIRDFHFLDDYEDFIDPIQLPVIHLHGTTRRIDRGIVFSYAEYARMVAVPNPWMLTLSEFIRTEPFIVAGASLEEFDLEYYLSLRDTTSARYDRGPSIWINPFPDPVVEADCERFNLLLYKGTIIEFLEELDAAFPRRYLGGAEPGRDQLDIFDPPLSERELASFSADFDILTQSAERDPPRLNFFYGFPPSNENLRNADDIDRFSYRSVVPTLKAFARGERDALPPIVLLDLPGTGKSTLLRRVGYDLTLDGVPVLRCRSLYRFDPTQIAQVLNRIQSRYILLFDNFADFALPVAELLELLRPNSAQVLGAERAYRAEYIRNAMSGPYRAQQVGVLSATEVRKLIDKLDEVGLTADRAASFKPAAVARSLRNEPIAVTSCRVMHSFQSVDRIADSLIHDAERSDLFSYLVVSLAALCNPSGIRYSILSNITRNPHLMDSFNYNSILPLTFSDATQLYVVPMNRTLSDRVLRIVKTGGKADIFAIFNAIADHLAPYVNRRAVQRRTPEALLAGRLFDYDHIIRELIPDRAEAFFSRQQQNWQWNSRFWGQRALIYLAAHRQRSSGHVVTEELRLAVQYARHGVARETHQLPLTTLASVLIQQIGLQDVDNDEVYGEAFENLDAALKLEHSFRRITIQPIMTLMRGTIEFLEHGGELNPFQRGKVLAYLTEARKVFDRDMEVMHLADELDKLI